MKTIQKSTLALLASLLLSTASYATVNCQQTQNVQSFVQRFYVKILERQPDNAGLDDWTNKLTAHERTGATLAEGFIFSGEYTGKVTNNESYVTTLYKAFFNREPDTEGFNGWVGDLNDGTKDRAQVLHGFLYSGEFKNLSDSYGIQAYDGAPFTSPDLDAFVTGFYQVVLGRTPADTEVAYWTAKLSTGESTGSDIAHGFVFSAEYNEGSKSDTAFLTTLYQAFFDRAPDTDGMNYWLGKIAEGMDRTTLLENFLQSAEFVNLTNSYGILAYPGAPTANSDDNVAPVANAGSDQSIEQGTQVTLDGSLSQDSDGNIACYWWREGSTILGDSKTLTLPTHELSIAPHTTTLTVVDDKGVTQSDSTVIYIQASTGANPTSITHNGTTYGFVTSPYTGKVWLDRNLGAAEVCTSSTDTACYGDYYQWGRNSDGHQDSTSSTTMILATNVNSVGSSFIISDSSPYDWTTADSDGSLRSANWSKTDGSSVCPVGFRVPTFEELKAETLYRDFSYPNTLKLPAIPGRYGGTGTVGNDDGLLVYVWTSTVDGSKSKRILIFGDVPPTYFPLYGNRSNGLPVRCIRD